MCCVVVDKGVCCVAGVVNIHGKEMAPQMVPPGKHCTAADNRLWQLISSKQYDFMPD